MESLSTYNTTRPQIDLPKIASDDLTNDNLNTDSGRLPATQIARGAGITLAGDVFGKAVYFVSQVVLARLLGSELFGIYALGMVVFHLGQTFSLMGFPQGATRFIPVYNSRNNKPAVKGVVIQSVTLSFILGCIVTVFVWIFGENLAAWWGKPEITDSIRLFAVGIPFMAGMMVMLSATRGLKKMQYFVYVKNVFHPVANLGIFLLAFAFGFGLFGAVIAWVAATVFGFLLSLVFVKKVFGFVWRNKASYKVKELLSFSYPLLFVGFVQILFVKTDTLVLGYYETAAQIGIYNAAAQFIFPISMGLMALNSIFGPIVAELHNKHHVKELNNILKISARWTLLITLPVFLIIVLSPREVLSLFGQQYTSGWLSLVVLAVFFFLSVVIGPVTQTLIMAGRQKLELTNTLGCLALNVVLNVVLIPEFGILGAAIATGLSVFFLHVIRLIQVKRLFELWPFSLRYLKSWVVLIAVAGVTLFVKQWTINSTPFFSILSTSVTVMISFVTLLTLVGLNREDKSVLGAFKRRFKALCH